MSDKNWVKIASIYIGTVIGAGFASGQEIIQFFGVYGYRGVYGVLIAAILFSFIGASILLKVYKNKINDYEELILPILGQRIGIATEIIITLFLIIGFCVMLAGSGAIFYEHFGLSHALGIYIMSIAALITFLFSIKGISIVNSIIVPLLLIGIVATSILIILRNGLVFSNVTGVPFTKTGNWIISSILYVSYNSITAIVIMTSLFPLIKDEKSAIKGGIFGGIGLGVLAVFILIPSLILYTDIYKIEIPMLKIAEHVGSKGRLIYSLILWCAMFTTAVSSGYGAIKRISRILRINSNIFAVVFCFITIPLAKVGFSNLISTFYPLFGYLGALILILVTTNTISNWLRSKSR